ncbi:MAG TPA: hypothetical protein VKV22_02645 [Rhodanobacteraceae bacterium]|nr:hypothetical protein [Rhodanobacteraceae bacterium]
MSDYLSDLAFAPEPQQWKLRLSEDRIREHWNEISARLRRRWRKLTEEEILSPDGSAEYLARAIQQHYGLARREALLQVFEFECELQGSRLRLGLSPSDRRSLHK